MLKEFESFFATPSLVQTIIILCFTCGVGIFLGKLRLWRFSLGGACVFFSGILMAHFGAVVDSEMLVFAQNFGLVLFVYALGVQVGPGFVASFRKRGFKLNLWGMALILMGTAVIVLMALLGLDTVNSLLGILSGAVTNTPALGAAQQSWAAARGGMSTLTTELNDMALATAITYPMGVVGVILVLEVLKALFPAKLKLKDVDDESNHFVGEYYVRNEGAAGKTIAEIHQQFPVNFIVSRLFRNGRVMQATPDIPLEMNDHLLIVSDVADVDRIQMIFGAYVKEEDVEIKWRDSGSSSLVSRRVLVTKSEFNGVKLASLRIRTKFGVNVTRINRAEIDLVPAPNLVLQIGDRLTVVGPEDKVNELAERVGGQLKRLDTPYLVSIFIGMALGCLVGALPIHIPGVQNPLKLGIAGGPILVGIIMGAYGSRFRLTTYITHSANLMLRTLGLTLYLAGLGLSSGVRFFETLTNGSGMTWLWIGAVVTIVPTLVIGLVALRFTKFSFGTVGGLISGAMANPIALDFLNDSSDDNDPTVSYASVYPLGMFARVIIAQLLVVLLL